MKDLSIQFMGVRFPNPFCSLHRLLAIAMTCVPEPMTLGWGGVVFKTIGPEHYLIDEVSPRFDALTKENAPFVGFKNMEQIAEHPLEQNPQDLRRKT